MHGAHRRHDPPFGLGGPATSGEAAPWSEDRDLDDALGALLERVRKRRTAYRSGRRELVGFVSLKGALRPDQRKTKRRVSPRNRLRDAMGYGVKRTPFAYKWWKKG